MSVSSPYVEESLKKWVTLPDVVGKVSHFGGALDRGVTATETMAIPAILGVRELCRNPKDPWYIACRWGYVSETRKQVGAPVAKVAKALINQRVLVQFNGKMVVLQPRDWGPNIKTRRLADISPEAMRILGAKTDDIVNVQWVDPSTPLGVYGGTADTSTIDTNTPEEVAIDWREPAPIVSNIADFEQATDKPAKQRFTGFDTINVDSAITEANISRSIDGTDRLVFSVSDSKRSLIKMGVTSTAHTAEFEGEVYETFAMQKHGDTLNFELVPSGVAQLMSTIPEAPLGQKAGVGTREQFIATLAGEVGVKCLFEDKKNSTNVALTTEPETSLWESIGRLCSDVNMRRYYAKGLLICGSDKWLQTLLPPLTWEENKGGVESIDFDYLSGDDTATASTTIALDTSKNLIGRKVVIKELGSASGDWVISSVTHAIGSPTADITLERQQEELPEPPSEQPTVFDAWASDSSEITGLDDFVTGSPTGRASVVKSAMTQIGQPYLWGGKRPDGKAGKWRLDCSGLVQWAFHNAYGKSMGVPAGSAQQAQYFRKHGKRISPPSKAYYIEGAFLYKKGHVEISVGDGTCIGQRSKREPCRIKTRGANFFTEAWVI